MLPRLAPAPPPAVPDMSTTVRPNASIASTSDIESSADDRRQRNHATDDDQRTSTSTRPPHHRPT
jgi:hypothetical protein